MPPTTFLDMKEQNDQERERLLNRRYLLERMKGPDLKTKLEPQLEAEYKDVVAKTTREDEKNDKSAYKVKLVDPFFIAVRRLLGESVKTILKVEDPEDGRFPGTVGADELMLAAVYGILRADSQGLASDDRLSRAVSAALGEYTADKALYVRVFEIINVEGNGEVRSDQWAGAARTLHADGIAATNEYIRLRTLEALRQLAGGGTGSDGGSSIEISLPDLDEGTDTEIAIANVKAMQALYFAAMLDEMKFFAVTDKLVEQFQNGMLPLGRGNAGNALYQYWKKSVNRISEPERRNLYARGFGFPGGDAVVATPNREFADLWLRFVSAVSSYVRQVTVDDLLRSNVPFAVSAEQVRKSGRDLAANLSLHGYGIAYFAATELQGQINDVIALLSDPEIKAAYGARDMWQVIEQVSIYELGGARNTVRYRTMATAGAIIIRWLATHTDRLAGTFGDAVLDVDQIRRPPLRPKGVRATDQPTDRDLVDACEQWLAVTGTPEQRVEEYAQPIEAPNTTSRPVQIPQAARDLLDSVGVQASVGPQQSNGRLAAYR